MTATHDRPSDLDDADGDVAWAERALLNNARGWPWWGAVLLAFGLTLAGGVLDQQLTDGVSTVFHSAYFVGCVGAICVVRRGSLFGPTVQPPLVLGISVPIIALGFSSAPSVGGLRDQLLIVGTPLINGFPAMALTSGVTLAVALLRIYWLQKDPDADLRRSQVKERSRAKAKAAGKARAERARTDRPQRGAPQEGARGQSGRAGSTRDATRSGTARAGGRNTAASARDRRGEQRGGTRQGARPAGAGRPDRDRSSPAERSSRGGERGTGDKGDRGGSDKGRADKGRGAPPRRPRGDQPPRRNRDD